jgi:hypothetical protein
VADHWLMFGASGYVIRPPMPSIEYFTHRIPDNRFVHRGIKSAVKPKEVIDILLPHLFLAKKGMVRENFEIIEPRKTRKNTKTCHDHFRNDSRITPAGVFFRQENRIDRMF